MNHARTSVATRPRASRPGATAGRATAGRGTVRRATALAAVAAALLAGCAAQADSGADDGGPDVDPAVAPTSSSEPVDLASFAPVDNATWLGIQAAPEASAGQRIVVHAFVTRTYTATGGGTLQVRVTSAQPASEVEGTVAVLRGSPDVLGAAQIGSVLRVHAEVAGAYAGPTGGAAKIPELTVLAAEDVGPYDLSADVTVGEVSRGSGRLLVPVTVRNSSDAVLTYRVDLVATSADGTVQQSGARPEFASLAPGSSASMDVRLEPASADAVLSIAAVTRTLPDAAP
ncbi:hypothetical protein [Actinotalea fermentans]|uniref:Uncharacterized protein n=1 Tax=Actinotalea fermentans TaxID=43671 RepID=A0A511YZ38_9CELL|nr:hypothetical protein [Actinotalea fermentans]GEN80477.1 hypothetical protein AFE02nite_22110 [Actinotalea fermentans]